MKQVIEGLCVTVLDEVIKRTLEQLRLSADVNQNFRHAYNEWGTEKIEGLLLEYLISEIKSRHAMVVVELRKRGEL
jgi:hypothetical protein